MDRIDQQKRSWNMSRIKGKNTKPEMTVRRYLWAHGFRYRVNDQRLPGKPDIVLTKYRTVIFVHGCFWHGHENCRHFRIPKTNVAFWSHKIEQNRSRDMNVRQQLRLMGWRTMVLWECQLRTTYALTTLDGFVRLLQESYLKDHSATPIKERMVAEDDLAYGEESTKQ